MRSLWTRVLFVYAVAATAVTVGLAMRDRPADRVAPAPSPDRDRVADSSGVAAEPTTLKPAPPPPEPAKAAPVVPEVKKALDWLVERQGKDGGLGQNDGSEPDVANTAMAALALFRSGNTPKSGPYRDALARAVDFVRRNVESSGDGDAYVTTRHDTQPQRKVGPFVDTFLACQLLGEVDGNMPDLAAQSQVRAALDRCVKKTQSCQAADGSFNQGGWAPVLGSTFACKALQIAEVKGAKVDRDALARAEDYMLGLQNREDGRIDASAGAGVDLYARSAVAYSLSAKPRVTESGEMAFTAPAAAEHAPAVATAARELGRGEVLRGFGSMGGEEFVSYMMASTSLAGPDGQGSTQWNGQIRGDLAKLQNADGSWAGSHCITGRVFCTSAAVLTLVEASTPKIASSAR
ncbi:MAG TPA: prenyltransferase/squalene oxidase repeat-containing protein [Planctomycetota bacterium]|jgi:hypothetical protein|nr:prenyltransferase/squalene oxidase repeat-containing protein [Planctomycetota bacterium]